jgi:tyrosyl-tRNA synthetase
MADALVGSSAEHLEAFEQASVALIEREKLRQRLEQALRAGRPLRVKFGMDPSSPDLHVGHAVPLLKLRRLQELGHTIVLIVGDSTAMVGDPSGRNQLRPQLSREQVEANLCTYTEQAGRVLDMERTEVRRNSEWFDRMGFEDLLRLMGRMTVARMLERDIFERRLAAGEPIGIHEFLYPLMQGWDSVMIRADVELGGSDQLFNLLVGRQLQEGEGQRGQICFTLPLIDGLDGRKMSKSYGNAIGITDPPAEMFGKAMSIPDERMASWFPLLTPLAGAEIASLLAGHPREAKARLAQELVRRFHGEAAAKAAREAFDRQFRDRELPSGIPELPWPAVETELPLAGLLHALGLASSTSEARRLVAQGGVRLEGVVQADPTLRVARPTSPILLQVGKRRFARLLP